MESTSVCYLSVAAGCLEQEGEAWDIYSLSPIIISHTHLYQYPNLFKLGSLTCWKLAPLPQLSQQEK